MDVGLLTYIFVCSDLEPSSPWQNVNVWSASFSGQVRMATMPLGEDKSCHTPNLKLRVKRKRASKLDR